MSQPKNKVNVKKQQVTVIKVDEVKQIVKGIVYEPNVTDAHDDWMSADDIEDSAYTFMKNLNNTNVDTNHDLEAVNAFVCESYIAKSNDPDGYPEGAWIVAVKIEDPEVWQGVLDGDYGGFSMYGVANVVDDAEPPVEN